MKILLLSESINPVNGWGNLTYELCQEFYQRRDIIFDLYLPYNAHIPQGIQFIERVHPVLPKWISSFGRRPWQILAYLGKGLPVAHDLVHTIVEFPYSISAFALAKQHKIPYIISTQGTYAVVPFRNWLDATPYRQAVRRAQIVTAPSQFTADSLRAESKINRTVNVVHNPVNFARFQESVSLDVIRKNFCLPNHARVILGVGGLKRRKGFDLLIRAFAKVASDDSNLWLVIAGDGPQRTELLALATSLGVDARVRLPGNVEGSNLVGLYQLCELYAHLPRSTNGNFEGFGIVYLEASACGKPIVASRSGGVADAVIDGKTGFLVEEEDWESAAEAIHNVLSDQTLANKLGQAGRNYASTHTWQWYADEMVNLYKSITAQQ